MERDYYTIKEAAEYLNCPENDIYHFLETGKVGAVIYTNRRPFLVESFNEDKNQWEGLGTVHYRGLLSVKPYFITTLLDEGEVILDKRAVPLKPNEYKGFSNKYPFDNDALPPDLAAWSLEKPDIPRKSVFLIPLPEQSRDKFEFISELTTEISKAFRNEDIDYEEFKSQKYTYHFKYNENGTYLINDIRLLKETVSKLNNVINENGILEFDHQGLPTDNLNYLPWCNSMKKPRRIYEVIERVFRHLGNEKAKTLWNALERDHNENEKPLYDPNDIIIEISFPTIDWQTLDKKSSDIAYKTFENKISDLRKFYKSINSI